MRGRKRRTAPKRRPIHDNIRRLRAELGLTQEQLADEVGEEKSLVSHWERAHCSPRSSKLPRIAAALGTTVDALLSGRAA